MYSGMLTNSAINFYDFLRDEVLFYMESNYRTSPFISLVGQGYSANLITHFLQESKPFINSYICINPSFSDFIGKELNSYNLPKFGKQDNTFYVYINNSNSFSSNKQVKIDEVQKANVEFQYKLLEAQKAEERWDMEYALKYSASLRAEEAAAAKAGTLTADGSSGFERVSEKPISYAEQKSEVEQFQEKEGREKEGKKNETQDIYQKEKGKF